jgi:transposase
MGLSRRLFTKEFKLAAVRRLEQGVSIGEVARSSRSKDVQPLQPGGALRRCGVSFVTVMAVHQTAP